MNSSPEERKERLLRNLKRILQDLVVFFFFFLKMIRLQIYYTNSIKVYSKFIFFIFYFFYYFNNKKLNNTREFLSGPFIWLKNYHC